MAVKLNHDGGLVVKRMGRIISFFVLILICLGGCQSKTAALVQGKKTPLFQLKSLDGDLQQFPDMFAGKVVVIRFWADWCPFCKSEMKSIEPIYQKYRSKGLVMLALNVRQDRKTAAAFINKLGISYDVLLDEEGEIARNYGVIGLPTTFIIDRQGLLHTRIIGESSAELFEQIVAELL
jgi:cytochrome c biogenesis protein CcmG, thiol:disulfide interchange protein DsbE